MFLFSSIFGLEELVWEGLGILLRGGPKGFFNRNSGFLVRRFGLKGGLGRIHLAKGLLLREKLGRDQVIWDKEKKNWVLGDFLIKVKVGISLGIRIQGRSYSSKRMVSG